MQLSVRGIVFLLFTASTAFVGSIFVLPMLFLIFYPIPATRHLYRKGTTVVSSTWFALTACLLEFIYNIKIFSNLNDVKHAIPAEANVLVLSNHRTRIDWMLLWCLFARHPQPLLSNLKIILKASLERAPFFGWAMRHFRFLFLRRDLSADEKNHPEPLPDVRHCGRAPLQLAAVSRGHRPQRFQP
eukprot:PhM_4_TR11165/c0_g1_i1/m.3024/K13513/LCLAT1, AGPAT8; lysocardiolipin and lysophospholipid acyltransferase